MPTIIVPWYRSSSERHNSELLGALFSNLSAPGVERLICVSEDPPPPVSHPKLEFVTVDARPTFWRLFELVRDEGPFAVLNADCAIQDARHLSVLREPDCLWVTRWGVHHGKPGNGRYYLDGGADLFGFACVPDRLPKIPCAPGEVYCDRVLGRELQKAGYRPRNLPWAVPLIHFHAERVRLEDEERPATGEYTNWFAVPEGEPRSPLWHEPFVARPSV